MSHEPTHRAGPPGVPPQRAPRDESQVAEQQTYGERFAEGDLEAILAPYHR